jgi:transposase
MEKFSLYVGIDVSKAWLDIAILSKDNQLQKTDRIDNTVNAISDYVRTLRSFSQTAGILFCLENTGKYGNAFLNVSATLHLNAWVEHPLQIKRSLGMTRGKTDRQDAIRIAQYAFRFQDKVSLWKPEEKVILQLKELQAKRELLVKTYRMLRQSVTGKDSDLQKPLIALQKSIDKVEAKIEGLILVEPKLCSHYKLIQSVPGIGKVVATRLLITTKAFTQFTNPRKLACYVGITPFPYQSGSSIKYKNRVSKLGDQKLKSLLNMSAWNAIRSVPALKAYFERKVAQGKHKMSVINAVRNKLVAMVLSVVRRNQPYTKEYSLTVC